MASLPSLAKVEEIITVIEDVLTDAEKLALLKNFGIDGVLTDVVSVLAEVEEVLKEL